MQRMFNRKVKPAMKISTNISGAFSPLNLVECTFGSNYIFFDQSTCSTQWESFWPLASDEAAPVLTGLFRAVKRLQSSHLHCAPQKTFARLA